MAYTYANENKAKPVSFAVTFAIHAGVIGALVLIPGAVVTVLDEDDSIETTWVEVTPVKPPPPPSPTQEVETRISRPDRVVDTLPPPDRPFTTDLIVPPIQPPPIGGLGGIGTGGIEIAPIEKPKPPVFVAPKIDSRYAGQFQPTYPPGKLRQEIEGSVRVRVLIGTDGRVKQIERLSASDDAFYEATARQAKRSWRFIPATEDGKKIEYWYELTVRFEVT